MIQFPRWIRRLPAVENNWSQSLQILEGHSGKVSAVAFTSNSKLLASASNDKTVRLWDPAAGTLQSTLKGHSGKVSAVAFTSNSKLLASASNDKTVRLWDPAAGTLQSTLRGHSDRISAVALSSNGKLLASASFSDRTVRLWDPAAGTLLQTSDMDRVTELSFSADDSTLITNCGVIKLRPGFEYTQSLSSTSSLWFVKGNWLYWDNHRILWIPKDFRPSCSAIRGDLLVMGHYPGVVTFLELDSKIFKDEFSDMLT